MNTHLKNLNKSENAPKDHPFDILISLLIPRLSVKVHVLLLISQYDECKLKLAENIEFVNNGEFCCRLQAESIKEIAGGEWSKRCVFAGARRNCQ
jgi:hypothetical protein